MHVAQVVRLCVSMKEHGQIERTATSATHCRCLRLCGGRRQQTLHLCADVCGERQQRVEVCLHVGVGDVIIQQVCVGAHVCQVVCSRHGFVCECVC